MPQSPPAPASRRLPYLDWLRGIAAITMLQGHVFQSFLRNDLRPNGPYQVSQFAGGMPPAIFLFLLGVTFAFLMDSQERKGVAPGARVRASVRRSGYLFAAAFAFRLQLWAFSLDGSAWRNLLRVDILNCMGMALLVMSVMAVFRTVERIRLCAVLGAAIAIASPMISNTDWSWTPTLLRNYIVPDHDFFSFFPWAAFVAFGMSAGSILRLLKEEDVAPTMQWLGWGGVALAFAAYSISNMSISIYSSSDFWLNSPALIFIKLGAVLILIAFSYVWNFKESLSVGQTVFASVVVIVAMLGLSLVRTNWVAVKAGIGTSGPAPRRVSGD
jgi:uncharacterized membrane protein